MSAPANPAVAAQLRRGARDTVAVIVAYLPFGMAVGAALAHADVPPLVAWASSPLLFGGAGQLLAVQLLGAGAGAVVTVSAVLVVNARFLLYGAALAPHVADWPRRTRWAAAHLLADPVYALVAARFAGPAGSGPPRERRAYYAGVGVTLWVVWSLVTGLGMLLAGALPAGLRLDDAAPLTFLLLLLPMLGTRAAVVAAASGGLAAAAVLALPLGLDVLVGAAAGVAAGALAARSGAAGGPRG
ncbi:AzlC family ABC transporter permease [Pseudonocardia broussonetiae]|uniref:AzlC family ABC transporter permease n=1 Tax=Pseudonocardia broussonetiae TaxID=2736640 RepID=A0A6M6JLZ9_9PSEU|nr:AzlC family ABC transporter permease [Pseudonocardia broussonetiae]QJY47439.1 AzlC family ABC transporter permease [Pseudonocardia broussonetiae]